MALTIILSCIGSSGLFAFLQFLIQRKDGRNAYATVQDLESVNEGMMALLQYRLDKLMTSCLARQSITAKEVEIISTMLSAYEANGGNGYIHTMWEHVQQLPLEE